MYLKFSRIDKKNYIHRKKGPSIYYVTQFKKICNPLSPLQHLVT
jgi:hypothetical protein